MAAARLRQTSLSIASPGRYRAVAGMEIRAFCLTGPTAAGKTEIAHRLALRAGYDVLSADAMLVYRGMNIGTAKPTVGQQSEVRYFGIDLAAAHQVFTVADYRAAVAAQLEALPTVSRRPLLVVGTGLYLKALTMGLDKGPPADPERRRQRERTARIQGLETLQTELRNRAPDWYASLADNRNPRRLIRALEWCDAGFDRPPDSWRRTTPPAPLIALRLETEILHQRIAARVEDMVRAGLWAEAGRLAEAGGFSRTARPAIGYAEALDVRHGQLTEPAAVARIIVRTRQLAKRQMTWLRHQPWVEWISLDSGSPLTDTINHISQAWIRYGSIPLNLP